MKFPDRYILFLVIGLFPLLNRASNDSLVYQKWQAGHQNKVVFIENAGQLNYTDGTPASDIFFKVELSGVNIFVTKQGLSYLFLKPHEILNAGKEKKQIGYDYTRINIDLLNATIKKENILKANASSYAYNYFYGHCPGGIYGVKEFDRLVVKDVYPGIDWVLYSSAEKGLKYDFVVHPGADPAQITLVYQSLNPLTLNDKGIHLETDLSDFVDASPVSYVRESGKEIKSHYVIKNSSKHNMEETVFYKTEIAFNVSDYNKEQTLVIDPLQQWWGTYYGGTLVSQGVSITRDSQDNIFVLGNTNSLDIYLQPYGTGSYFQGTYGGANGGGFGDLFMLKFTNAGQLLWATYLGGKNIEENGSIKCDHSDNIFVTAETQSYDLPLKDPGSGAYYDTTNGITDWLSDLYIGKFSNSGTYLWGTYYGGDAREHSGEISIDANNNVWCTGSTESFNFPVFDPGNGAFFQGTLGANFTNFNDVALLKFSNSGQRLYASYFGGDSDDQGLTTACDHLGNVYIAGRTSSTDLFTLNPGGGAYHQVISAPFGSILSGFILKLNSNNQAVWSTYISGTEGICHSIVCDSSGNLFMAGRFRTNFPTVNPGGGAFFLGSSLNTDLLISKFNTSSQMVWATYYGTWGSDGYANLALGPCNEIYMTCRNTSTCVACPPMQVQNPGNGAYYDNTYNDSLRMGLSDMFIAAFSNSGILRWGTFFGGTGNDVTMEVVCDRTGNLFYTGQQGLNYYYTPALLQTYIDGCIKNPGGGAYFQGTPNAPLQWSTAYCVIGKFTSGSLNASLAASGCNLNDTITAQISSGWGPYTYSWSNGATTNTIVPPSAGTYSCHIVDGFFGCSTDQQIYFGSPAITVSSGSPVNTICAGQSMSLSASGASSYSWSPVSDLNTAIGSTVIASPLSTMIYTVTGTSSVGCASANTVMVNVNALPVVTLTGNDSICKGNNASIIATGALNYTWSPPADLNIATGASVTANPAVSTIYTVLAEDVNECSVSQQFTLTVIQYPEPTISGPAQLCIGSAATLTVSGADEFIWKTTAGQYPGASITVHPSAAETYTLYAINAARCADSVNYTILVNSLPSLSVYGPDSICSGQEFGLTANGNGSFSWQTSADLTCYNCPEPLATIDGSAMFYVTITDVNNCFKTDSVFVIRDNTCGNIVIPNVFTPNGDGVNDLFKIHGTSVNQFECEIYDRWGLKLFVSNNLDVSWTGTVKEKPVPDGVYYYLIKVTNYDGKANLYKGFLTLIRG